MPEIIVKLGDQVVQKYYFYKDSIGIGRAPSNEISIENLAVSRRHATVTRDGESYILEDLGSSNGTFINAVRVTKAEIVDKDVVSIGKHKLYFYNNEVSRVGNEEKTMVVTNQAERASGILRIRMGKGAEREFKLEQVETNIGRGADNDIRVQDWFLSSCQAQITRKGLIFVIRNVGNWRRTQVNGQQVDEQALKPGDVIQVGRKLKMIFDVLVKKDADAPVGRKPIELSAGSPDAPLPIAGQASVPPGGSPFDTIGVPGMNATPANNAAKPSPTADIRQVWNDIPEPQAADSEGGAHPEAEDSDSGIDDAIMAPSVRLDLNEISEESVATSGDPRVESGASITEEESVAGEGPDPISADDPLNEVEPASASEMYQPDLSAHPAAEHLFIEGQNSREEALVASIMEAVGEAQGLDVSDIKVWVHALFNSSEVIRKQAQRKLKQLTGETYGIQQQQ